jgi:nitroreductase
MPKSFDQILQERRSVRAYADTPVAGTVITELLEAARCAPSACNAQPWRFVVVRDPAQKRRLTDTGLGGMVPNAWAQSAPVIIVACSDLQFFTHRLAEKVQGVEYHLIDLGIALEHLVLKATEHGLGTCYIGWFKGAAISRLLSLPSSWKVECLVTLGYPAVIPDPTPRKSLADISRIV